MPELFGNEGHEGVQETETVIEEGIESLLGGEPGGQSSLAEALLRVGNERLRGLLRNIKKTNRAESADF